MTDRSFAVVTGASSGIGRELARQFAAHDFDLLICAEDDAVAAVGDELRAGGAEVTVRQADLSKDCGVYALYAAIRALGRPVDAIALNAGVGAGGSFAGPDALRTSLADELRIIDLNVRSTVQLAKYVVADMVERDAGRVLFTSSIAATMPGSFQAVYNASKSFVQSFALALRHELKDTGVTVTSLMPGPTETAFFERADMLDTKVGASDKDDPADVARQGFEALMAGRERVVAGVVVDQAPGQGEPADAGPGEGGDASADGTARFWQVARERGAASMARRPRVRGGPKYRPGRARPRRARAGRAATHVLGACALEAAHRQRPNQGRCPRSRED